MAGERFKYVVVVDGSLREFHQTLSAAEKSARFWLPNPPHNVYHEVYVAQILLHNGDVIH